MKNNPWRFAIVVFVIAWAIYEMTPIKNRSLVDDFAVKAVSTDEAFDNIVAAARQANEEMPHTEFQNLRDAIGDADIVKYFPDINIPADKNPTRTILLQLQREASGKLKLGLDLQGGMSFMIGVDTSGIEDDLKKEDALSQAIDVLRKRVDRFGVSEPVIQAQGTDRVEIQLPGLSQAEAESVRVQITKPAVLQFRLVHPSSETIVQEGIVPPRHEMLPLRYRDDAGKVQYSAIVVEKKEPEGLTGKYLSRAGVSRDMVGAPMILLTFDSEGAALFAKVTRDNPGRQLAIVLDGEVYSAPAINEPITGGSAQITGDFTSTEAFELVNVLENPLETPVKILEERSVDPTLGADSIAAGIKACLIGVIVVAVFMLIYYFLSGVIANVALIFNIIVLLGVMASLKATLTLPGIAGIVLTIGMAVDANVLIFERIREELKHGKSVKGAVAAGYDKVFSTIFDANITTLIASIILIVLGTGPVKGFGTTLTIGIVVSMFTALVVTRMIYDWLLTGNKLQKLPMLGLFGDTKIRFLNWWKPAFALSWLLIFVGIGCGIWRGSDLFGIDFRGGDSVMLGFDTKPELADVRAALDAEGIANNLQFNRDMGTGEESLTVYTEYENGTKVFGTLTSALPDVGFAAKSLDTVGPQVGREIQQSALLAAGLALFGILIYVAFRFEFSFAIGAVVAVLHDVLMAIGVFALAGGQFSAPMVAALLTIIGFSINDTIVVFDRIREDIKMNVKGSFRELIDMALNKTLSRTVITSGTTLLSTLALYIFGGVVIHDFAFTFLVGIIVGTYSSVYIASAIVLWWTKGERPVTRKPVVLEDDQVVDVSAT